MESLNKDGIIALAANKVGASDSALRVLLTLLLGYPLGFFHRKVLCGQPTLYQHIYFTSVGIILCYFNFGTNTLHSVLNICIIYALLKICGGTSISVAAAFVINISYLCIGYYMTMKDTYQIRWTTPHCVLTLRLTGLVFDVFDGKKKKENMEKEQMDTALTEIPSFLEVTGHTYFFGGFFVGPQFPMKRYQNFIKLAAAESPVFQPACVVPALMRLLAGIAYLIIFQVTYLYFPDSYLESQEFKDKSFIGCCSYIFFWGKFTVYKYLSVWLIAEGVCILSGLTNNGRDENGNDLWDACANIKIRQLEVAYTCHRLVASFNINTNKWVFKYIFKRLKHLDNKDLSQIVALFFLALWHGLYTGYFMNFFIEFLALKFEKDLHWLLMKKPEWQRFLDQPVVVPIRLTLCKIYSQFILSYALISFCLFTTVRWLSVYHQVYYFVHIFFLTWMVLFPYLRKRILTSVHKTAYVGTDDISSSSITSDERKIQ